MFRRKPAAIPNPDPCCSFCRKGEDVVGQLISNPSDYPRAYICDECVAVCHSIMADGPDEPEGPSALVAEVVQHPLGVELIAALREWVRRDAAGLDSSKELAELRRLALLILPPGPKTP